MGLFNADIRVTSDAVDLLGVRTYSFKPIPIPAFTASQNDLDITDGKLFYLSATAPVNITGLKRGFNGREITLFNIGTNAITLKHDDAASAAANRILNSTGGDVTISSKSLLRLFYDGTDTVQRWRSESLAITTSGDILTVNSFGPDGAGNMLFQAATGTGNEIKFVTAAGSVTVEPPDWHFFTMPPADIPALSVLPFGTFVIPTGKKVNKVRLGVRNAVTDAADADLQASVKNETSTEELVSSLQYPDGKTFVTTSAAGERLVISAKNNNGALTKTCFAQIGILLENA